MSAPLLAARSLSKSFGPNQVLKGIDFEVYPASNVALCGENGAGKSTLIKLLTGLYTPTDGHVEVEGEVVAFSTVKDSIARGIAVVHQEFSTIDGLTVAENIYLEDEPTTRFGLLDRKKLLVDSQALLDRLGIDLNPNAVLEGLSVAEKQMVEIAKALRADAKVLILDEPTAVLSDRETVHLFKILNNLRDSGMGLVYVSHRLDEIFELCTHITVIKDGGVTVRGPIAEFDHDRVVTAMVGRSVGELFPPKNTKPLPDQAALEIKDLVVEDTDHKLNLKVKAGEIVGLAGLVGAGRTELLNAIYGSLGATGEVLLFGQRYDGRSPTTSLGHGLVMLTESRKDDGLFIGSSVAWNYVSSTLGKDEPAYAITMSAEETRANRVVADFNVIVNNLGLPISALSGGNQQKILIGRLLENGPKILLLDEPTRGVDIGAKAEIYKKLRSLADQGLAVLMVSSELIEVVGLSDRVYVMRDQEIAAELLDEDISEDGIIRVAAGGEESIGHHVSLEHSHVYAEEAQTTKGESHHG